MSNSSIRPIDKTISGATTPGQSGSKRKGNEEVFAFPKFPALFNIIYRTLVWGCLTPLQRCSRCILLPQSSRPHIIVNTLSVLDRYT